MVVSVSVVAVNHDDVHSRLDYPKPLLLWDARLVFDSPNLRSRFLPWRHVVVSVSVVAAAPTSTSDSLTARLRVRRRDDIHSRLGYTKPLFL